ncbi:hypothetical protein GX51_03962 [Blastomyces parvus]|uniref:Uncharacterized protein n=1 Tax=Blastomyces parvus TaxID=2060905 RepID=A0A2B7X4V0_9EURO|nr:hypothetical protein GX51_03962 [Blastomyces parvus]
MLSWRYPSTDEVDMAGGHAFARGNITQEQAKLHIEHIEHHFKLELIALGKAQVSSRPRLPEPAPRAQSLSTCWTPIRSQHHSLEVARAQCAAAKDSSTLVYLNIVSSWSWPINKWFLAFTHLPTFLDQNPSLAFSSGIIIHALEWCNFPGENRANEI